MSLPKPVFFKHAKLYYIKKCVNARSKSEMCIKLDTPYNTYTNIIHQHLV